MENPKKSKIFFCGQYEKANALMRIFKLKRFSQKNPMNIAFLKSLVRIKKIMLHS
jgi:hypothetical protein